MTLSRLGSHFLGDENMNQQLYHHGILGQKWGVRRFQRKDGSLTTAGMKRYGVEGRSYEEYKADRKHYKKHGLRADIGVTDDGKNLYVDKLYNHRTGKEIDERYAHAIMNKKGAYLSDSKSQENRSPVKQSSAEKQSTNEMSNSPEKQKRVMTKGRAAVHGILRQMGMSAAAGIGQAAAIKLGGDTLANYGTMAVKGLYMAGTAANIGYTTYKVVKSKWKKDL